MRSEGFQRGYDTAIDLWNERGNPDRFDPTNPFPLGSEE